MSLPRSLLDAVEDHPCFSGCYTEDSAGALCTDPGRPVRGMLIVHCCDCLLWHTGATTDTLPPSAQTPQALATALSSHMRRHRGLVWSIGGYHSCAGGTWISATCLAPGFFLVHSDRGSGTPNDPVDALITAFRHGLAPYSDPGMLDRTQYQTESVFLRYSATAPLTPDKASLLRSPQCSTRRAPGHHPVTIVEHVPSLGRAANTPATYRVSPEPAAPRPPQAPEGTRCSTCGHEVKQRALLHGTFLGCMC